MGIVRTIAVVILSISFIVFVALFGRLPAFRLVRFIIYQAAGAGRIHSSLPTFCRRTPIAFLHRFLWHHIPNAVIFIDEKLTGRRFTRGLAKTGNYLMNEAHPIVLVSDYGLGNRVRPL